MAKSKKTATYTPRKRRSPYINVQRHKASCGPIAIANVIKWCRIETSYKAVMDFCLGIRAYDRGKGMFPFQLRYALKVLCLNFKVKRRLTLQELDAHLDSGGSAIFGYQTMKPGDSHIVFIDARNEEGYRTWNVKRKLPPFMSRETLQTTIDRSMKTQGIYVYFFQQLKPIKK